MLVMVAMVALGACDIKGGRSDYPQGRRFGGGGAGGADRHLAVSYVSRQHGGWSAADWAAGAGRGYDGDGRAAGGDGGEAGGYDEEAAVAWFRAGRPARVRRCAMV